MKKTTIFLLCALLWISVGRIAYCEDLPPIQPSPVRLTKVPPVENMGPSRPKKDDSRIAKKPTLGQKQNLATYVIIGMYDRMLEQVQHKRFWPVSDPRYDGCVMLHATQWICP